MLNAATDMMAGRGKAARIVCMAVLKPSSVLHDGVLPGDTVHDTLQALHAEMCVLQPTHRSADGMRLLPTTCQMPAQSQCQHLHTTCEPDLSASSSSFMHCCIHALLCSFACDHPTVKAHCLDEGLQGVCIQAIPASMQSNSVASHLRWLINGTGSKVHRIPVGVARAANGNQDSSACGQAQLH